LGHLFSTHPGSQQNNRNDMEATTSYLHLARKQVCSQKKMSTGHPAVTPWGCRR
jgi:hypothetical protein